jgi:hypothetical protein
VAPFQRSDEHSPDAKEALVALNFRVPFKLRQRMKFAATARGITMTELFSVALERYLQNETPRVAMQQCSAAPDAYLIDEILNALKK